MADKEITESGEFSLYGHDLFGCKVLQNDLGTLSKRFIAPPFSVFDARQWYWQERKNKWMLMGIKSEKGRGDNIIYNLPIWMQRAPQIAENKNISIFDPVLCELMYSWFYPKGGQVVDPFAGGSVRGIVAASLGFNYWGCDLRSEQIEANVEQLKTINICTKPEWIIGDSMVTLETAPPADFIFSCPPYGDLEKYSDDPADLSNMEYHTFMAAYKRIILRSLFKLNDNSFACFVVGDFRDNRGFYRNFVGDTVNAFIECGAKLYNDAILLTMVGSAPIRASAQFDAGKKLTKCHQNVLIFCKGDWREATRKIQSPLDTDL